MCRLFFRAFLAVLIFLVIPRIAMAQNPGGIGPQAAAECLKQFTTPEGVAVSLFAAEPMVRNPTDMDIDHLGRVWIAEGVNYRSSFKPWGTLEPAGDRIVILEDTNHNGLADKETVFYQDPSINAALGVCVLGNKVIVSDSPNVFVLTDTNGDGVADQRELLFTGIEGFDHDHGVHAFSFGPDGKLYFNMGNAGMQLFYPDKKELPLHGPVGKVAMRRVIDLDGNEVNGNGKPYRMGMVFRCNVDGTGVETLAWNFRNNYEMAVDSFGTMWQSDNDDDGNRGVRINYLMDYGNYGYADETTGAAWTEGWDKAHAQGASEESKVFYEWHQFDPGVVPDLLHTGAGSPTGILVYEGGLLPPAFRNQILHCDAGPRIVRAFPVSANGAGYQAVAKEILTTADTWFRPSDLCTAPDGSVYVADWNDAAVGGHNMADQKVAAMTGRVYRLAPPGARSTVPVLNLNSAEGCVNGLRSPNAATRYLAWTKLHGMQNRAEKALLKLWQDHDPRMRARALQLLARIKEKENHYVANAIKDDDANIRITGLRIARELRLDIIPLVTKLARDPSPQVRRECAIALRHQLSSKAAELWSELASRYDGKDRWYLEALGIGADRQWDSYLSAWLSGSGNRWDTPAGRDIVWRSRSHRTPELLAVLIGNSNLTQADRRHFFRSLDFTPTPERDIVLLELAGLKKSQRAPDKATIFEALSRLKEYDLEANGEVKRAVARMLDEVRGQPEFINLVQDFKLKNQEPGLMEIAAKQPFDGANVEAVRLLLNPNGLPLLKNGLSGANANTLARAIGSTGSKEIVSLLLPLVKDPGANVALRKTCVQALVQIKSGAQAVLKLAEEEKLPADLKLIAASELSQVRWDTIKLEAKRILPLPIARDAEIFPAISDLSKRVGDATQGGIVFRKDLAGCIKCHQVNREGVDFGPNLSEIGDKLGKDALYEAILDPSAGISFGFEAWQLTLKNGEEPFGLIISETPEDLTLKTVGGAKTKYQKNEITGRVPQKLSIMPAGIQQNLSVNEMVDLVEYLASLKKPVARAERAANVK